jgi:coenzyme PQQ precursor peptide PqqA
MSWSKPDFVEISLSMEVTAYVNTDTPLTAQQPMSPVSHDTPAPSKPVESATAL